MCGVWRGAIVPFLGPVGEGPSLSRAASLAEGGALAKTTIREVTGSGESLPPPTVSTPAARGAVTDVARYLTGWFFAELLGEAERAIGERRGRPESLHLRDTTGVLGMDQRPSSPPRPAGGHIADDHWRLDPTSVG